MVISEGGEGCMVVDICGVVVVVDMSLWVMMKGRQSGEVG